MLFRNKKDRKFSEPLECWTVCLKRNNYFPDAIVGKTTKVFVDNSFVIPPLPFEVLFLSRHSFLRSLNFSRTSIVTLNASSLGLQTFSQFLSFLCHSLYCILVINNAIESVSLSLNGEYRCSSELTLPYLEQTLVWGDTHSLEMCDRRVESFPSDSFLV